MKTKDTIRPRCKNCEIFLDCGPLHAKESRHVRGHCISCTITMKNKPITWRPQRHGTISRVKSKRRSYTSKMGLFKKSLMGADLVNYMNEKGLSDEAFSRKSKVNPSSVRKYKRGQVKVPQMRTLERICDILRTDPHSYFEVMG